MKTITEYPAEILLLVFLIITFFQSGLDKILDWKGNLSWLSGHFSETPLKSVVPALFVILTVTELGAGILSGLGLIQLLREGGKELAFWGAFLSCIAFLMLLFGQRMAKDYDGARTIAIYFIPAVFLVFLMQ